MSSPSFFASYYPAISRIPTLQQIFDPADQWQEGLGFYRDTKREGIRGGLSNIGRTSFYRFHNVKWTQGELMSARNDVMNGREINDHKSVFGRIAILSLATNDKRELLGTMDQSHRPSENEIPAWCELQFQAINAYQAFRNGDDDGSRALAEALNNLTAAHMTPAQWNRLTVADFVPHSSITDPSQPRASRPSLPMIDTAITDLSGPATSPRGSIQGTPVNYTQATSCQASGSLEMSATMTGPDLGGDPVCIEGVTTEPALSGLTRSRAVYRRPGGYSGTADSRRRRDAA